MHDAENTLVASEPIRVVGKDRIELDNAHGREKVNQSIAVWGGLMKGIEQDKTLLDMVIAAGPPSEVWKIRLGIVGDRSKKAAQDKVKNEFEKLTFRGKVSNSDHVARAKGFVLKLIRASRCTHIWTKY